MVRKLRASIALQPLATALFANSPFTDGRPNGLLSARSEIWRDTDNARAGMLPFVFEDGMGFERWVDYALDVPMYFVKRGDHYHDVAGANFRDLLAGRLVQLPGERATIGDWANHLSTLFPDVRLKRFLEMRGADGGPWRRICALPAFWVGLLYDDGALDAAERLTRDWTVEEVSALREAVPAAGLKAELHGRPLLDHAREVLAISRQGLAARARLNGDGMDETLFLAPLDEVIAKKATLADDMLAIYNGRWNGSVEPVFTDYQY